MRQTQHIMKVCIICSGLIYPITVQSAETVKHHINDATEALLLQPSEMSTPKLSVVNVTPRITKAKPLSAEPVFKPQVKYHKHLNNQQLLPENTPVLSLVLPIAASKPKVSVVEQAVPIVTRYNNVDVSEQRTVEKLDQLKPKTFDPEIRPAVKDITRLPKISMVSASQSTPTQLADPAERPQPAVAIVTAPHNAHVPVLIDVQGAVKSSKREKTSKSKSSDTPKLTQIQ